MYDLSERLDSLDEDLPQQQYMLGQWVAMSYGGYMFISEDIVETVSGYFFVDGLI